MITVRVPATSANIGSGFDSLGLAVNLYNTAQFAEADGLYISSADGTSVPTGEDNLIYRTVRQVYAQCGRTLKGLRLRQTNAVPIARGLGSSSACIVAGIMGANALLGNPLSQQDMLTLAVQTEGHPDNVAPALLGGFVASVQDGGKVISVKKDIAPDLEFAAFVPSFRLLTKQEREALPKQVAHKDAVYNLSRAALCALAFSERRYDLLRVATQDSLHQQYRLPLIDGGKEVFALARECGALAVYISGAGPTVMALAPAQSDFFAKAQQRLAQTPQAAAFTLHRLTADNEGAVYVSPQNK